MTTFDPGHILTAVEMTAVSTKGETAYDVATQAKADLAAILATPVQLGNILTFADNASALAAGVPPGQSYADPDDFVKIVRAAVPDDPVDPPSGDSALPSGWVQAFADDFVQAATSGVNALDPQKWGQRSYGTGPAHSGVNCFWDGAAGLVSTGTTVRVSNRLVDGAWRCTGFQQGSTNQPGAFGYHPGYGEFHCRFRMRYSQDSSGVGGYCLMWPASNEWSSELDWVEMPYSGVAMATMHWDPSGEYSLGTQGHNIYSSGAPEIDLESYHIWDCRRTYRRVNGVLLATVRVWIDDVEIPDPGGWTDNEHLTENMVFGAAGFVATGYNTDWYGAPDGSTPDDTYMELDYVYIWVPPAGGGVVGGGVTPPTPSIDISDDTPGTRSAGTWSVDLISTNTTSVSWVVANADFSWTSGQHDEPTTGTAPILPNFTTTGQYVKYWITSDFSTAVDTAAVIIV